MIPDRSLLRAASAHTGLDRAGERRGDGEWVAASLAAPGSRFLPLSDLKPAVVSKTDRTRTSLRWLMARELTDVPAEALLLGVDADGGARFAVNIPAASPLAETCAPFVDVRTLALQEVMPPEELAIAAQARALAAWHGVARCCGRCGAATAVMDAGWRRQCHACGLDIFPRTDPVVIMMVTDGGRCLLGRGQSFPDKFYSVLAGHIEPGDDIEHAVRRETAEETGVRIGRVAYVASQPWPFTHSLMIGCWAEALSSELTIDPRELCDARWVDRAEALAMLEDRHPGGLFVPRRLSIAHMLIRAFAEGTYRAPWE